jgi:hypothetical protein
MGYVGLAHVVWALGAAIFESMGLWALLVPPMVICPLWAIFGQHGREARRALEGTTELGRRRGTCKPCPPGRSGRLPADRGKNHDLAAQWPDLIERCAVLATVKTASRHLWPPKTLAHRPAIKERRAKGRRSSSPRTRRLVTVGSGLTGV